jgi:hypothetical protein
MTVSSDHQRKVPVVSIGVPVYNGGRHLEQALNSLLSQTFSDFEIIISDNASTDSTQSICQRFVRLDQRIRYLRQARNIGAPRNWSLLVHEARGRYFKWASANDYCSDRFVEQCLLALEADTRTILAFGKTRLVADDTDAVTDYDGDVEAVDDTPRDRFKRVSRLLRLNNAQSGLIRLDVLRKTGLDRPYQGGDLVLMAELALYGMFKCVPEALFFRRVGTTSLSALLPATELRYLINPDARAAAGPGLWKRHADEIAAILHAPIGASEQLACLRTAAQNAYWNRSWLARELWARIAFRTRTARA